MKKIHVEDETNKTLIADIEQASEFDYMVGARANLTLIITAFHPKTIDANVSIHLAGNGANATIVGIIVGSQNSKVSLHTMQLHEAVNTTSNLLVKSALQSDASFFYDGGIRVEKIAQKTDAYQRNENLILSAKAHAESKPALEILANDVRCTHGATVGPVSEEDLWFLRMRGINRKEAEMLIIEGFFRNALERVSDISIRNNVWQSIEGAL